MMEQQHATQPIVGASIAHELGMPSGIANRNSEMMVGPADVVRYPWLRAGEDKNAGFAIRANLIVNKYGAAFRPIHDDTG